MDNTDTEREQLLLKSKEALLKNRDTSPTKFISESEARQTNTSRNLGYLVYYDKSDGNTWRTKNAAIITSVVYDHNFSWLNDGSVEYKSSDGIVQFDNQSDRSYITVVTGEL